MGKALATLTVVVLFGGAVPLSARLGDDPAAIANLYGKPLNVSAGSPGTSTYRLGDFNILVTYVNGRSALERISRVDKRVIPIETIQGVLAENGGARSWKIINRNASGTIDWEGPPGVAAAYVQVKDEWQLVLAKTVRNSVGHTVLATDPSLGKPPWIAIEARSVSNAAQFESLWESGWGSYIRDARRTQTIEISLVNHGESPLPVKLVVVFVARTSAGHRQFFHSVGQKDFTLNREARFAVVCPPIPSRDSNYVALGERNLEGAELEGWFVDLAQNEPNRMLASAGSTGPLERVAANPGDAAFLKAMGEFMQTHQKNPSVAQEPLIQDLTR